MNRLNLKAVCGYINHARVRASEMVAEGEHAEWIVKLVNGLIDAENAGFNLLDATQIRSANEDREPLNSEEENVFHFLRSFLRLSEDGFSLLTHEQKFSAARVIVRQGGPDKIIHPVAGAAFCESMIGINFGHIYFGYIFIGIEPDGYAHS